MIRISIFTYGSFILSREGIENIILIGERNFLENLYRVFGCTSGGSLTHHVRVHLKRVLEQLRICRNFLSACWDTHESAVCVGPCSREPDYTEADIQSAP